MNIILIAAEPQIKILNIRKLSEKDKQYGIEAKARIKNIDEKTECYFEYVEFSETNFEWIPEETSATILSDPGKFNTKIPEEYYGDDFIKGVALSEYVDYYIRAVAIINPDSYNQKKIYSDIHKVPGSATDNFRNETFISAPDLESDLQLEQRGRRFLIKKNQKLSFDLEYIPTKNSNENNIELTINNTAKYLQDFKVGDQIALYIPDILKIKSRIIEVQEETTQGCNQLKITLGKRWPDMIEKIVSRNNNLDPEIRK
ncbi:Gp37-like protein [Sporohalobacter salinus]|uniref:Gp37-like protein n=1 Tax=Sporohalobacter salinus TaxID=1494606 RepID=UPI001960D296|nr:hypothetical protein [Sporohalobacter salinus]MBM7623707.1 hypothetical protein [Sporohalobacter salinus]